MQVWSWLPFPAEQHPTPGTPPLQQMELLLLPGITNVGGSSRYWSNYACLRGSGTCGQDRLELTYAEKCLLEISVSGPKWADDVQLHEAPWLYLTLLHSC